MRTFRPPRPCRRWSLCGGHDLDIYRTTYVLIREHGTSATLAAAQRAGAMLDHDDMDGGAIWTRIVTAVEEIERTERRHDEAAQ